ncbi:VOC family protein [Patulibacter minatonensis]|uniref:VOC family protein n=1 Tax=Patulibacter minatonensis TaxID=298163 RepID=UPI00047B01FE|nr:VOC family protein [Patulibacter minatonensis]
MTTPAHPSRSLIVNMQVADVERSRAFFLKLGFGLDPRASVEGQNALLVFGDEASVMLSSRESFAQYSKLPAGDPSTHALALYTFTVGSKDEVDAVSATALAEGATEADGVEDFGFMYTRSFFDLDGHGWQVMWVDPAAKPGAPEPAGTTTA